MKRMGIVISIGPWGNVYWYRSSGFGWRLCLGWVAITYWPVDGDDILDAASKYWANIAGVTDDDNG